MELGMKYGVSDPLLVRPDHFWNKSNALMNEEFPFDEIHRLFLRQ